MPTEIQANNAFYKAIVDQIATLDRLDASIKGIDTAVGQVSGKVDGITTSIGSLPFPTSIKVDLDPQIQGSLDQTVNLLGHIHKILQDQAGEPPDLSDDHFKLYHWITQVRVQILDQNATLNEINDHLEQRYAQHPTNECLAILAGHPDLRDRFQQVFRSFDDNPPQFQQDRARRVIEIMGLERDLAHRLNSPPPHAASGV
jgi:hypothetical protein